MLASKADMAAFMAAPSIEIEDKMLHFKPAIHSRSLGIQLRAQVSQCPGSFHHAVFFVSACSMVNFRSPASQERLQFPPCRHRSFYAALRACRTAEQSKWKVAVGKLPSEVCTKRRQVFTLSDWQDVWSFLRTIRTLAQPRSLGSSKFAVRDLAKSKGT